MLHEVLPAREDAEFRLKSWMEIFYEIGADLLLCLRCVQNRTWGMQRPIFLSFYLCAGRL